MVISRLPDGVIYRARAPLRLSFGGGGSEIPPYVNRHGGAVLSATIDRYAYATIKPSDDAGAVVFTAAADAGATRETLPLAAAYPPKEGELPLHRAVYNHIIRARNGGRPLPLHLHTQADAPVGSGLGTSSTLTVAMTRCFDEALGLNLDEYELARLAHDIERADLGLSGGYQDHYAAAFGGFNLMEFHPDGEVVVTPLRIRPSVRAELEYSLVLSFTGVSRESAAIIDAQMENLRASDEVVAAMHRIKALAYEMKDNLLTARLHRFAALLDESWRLKKSTAAAISNAGINDIYERARAKGALGGKISGAGGGGFLMLLVEPMRRREVLACLPAGGGMDSFSHFSDAGAFAWRARADG